MPSKIELLQEAYNRGLEIPAGKRALFDEAVRRGLVNVKKPTEKPSPQKFIEEKPKDPNEPLYSELGLPVGKPEHMGKAVAAPFAPLSAMLNAPGAVSAEGLAARPEELEQKSASILDFAEMAGQNAAKELGGFTPESGEAFSMTPELGGKVARIATEFALMEPYARAMGTLLKSANRGIEILGQKYTNNVTSKIDNSISKAVEKGMRKGVKFSVSGKGDAGKVEKYLGQSEKAVIKIIENSESKLPTTAEEFSNAIYETKKKIHDKYSLMAKEAGEKGAAVDLSPIIEDMKAVSQNPVLRRVNPSEADRLLSQAESWEKMGMSITPSEAEKMIAAINAETRGFWKVPNFNDARKVLSQERIANQLRKATDKAITEYKGPGYQELKKDYGSLSAIEKEVTNRATIDMRKNVKGFFDITDIASAGEFALGVARVDPTLMVSAGAMRGMKEYVKYLVSPNRYIKNMFSEVSRLTRIKNQRAMEAAMMAGEASPEIQAAKLLIEYKPYYGSELYTKSRMEKAVLKSELLSAQSSGDVIEMGAGKKGMPLSTPKGPTAKSTIPEKIKTTLHEAEAELTQAVKLRPDQEYTLSKRKIKAVESKIGRPLLKSEVEYIKSNTPNLAGSIKAVPKEVKQQYAKSEAIRKAVLKKAVDDINKFRKTKGLKPIPEREVIRTLEQAR